MSKRGLASRTEAARWVRAGRVHVDGQRVLDPEFPTRLDARIDVDAAQADAAEPLYYALNKPRGLITTANDDQARATIYKCLRPLKLPWLAPVGRLDKASEGLLLLSNDPQWAAGITAPASGLSKTYHVQVDRCPEAAELARLCAGISIEAEEAIWKAVSATLLRSGGKTAWLEIVLDEGRNRQIRRLLQALDIGVLRLVRVSIGEVRLGDLAKGQGRPLSASEVRSLRCNV